MTQILDYIPDDGYTEKAFIKAVPLIHGDVHFEFRPFITEERLELYKGVDAKPSDVFERQAAAAVAKRLRSWSIKNAKGEVIDCKDHKNLLKLKQHLWNRLFGIVVLGQAYDLDPEASPQETAEYDSIYKESTLSDKSFGDVRDEKAIKN